jgi:ankyrin repeat protein
VPRSSSNLADVVFAAGRSGETAPVFALLEQGADVDAEDDVGCTALARAAQFDQLELVRALLRAGASPDRANRRGGTPLMVAKSEAVARLLLAAGADPNAPMLLNDRGLPGGRTALMGAAWTGSTGMVEALLAHGADPGRRDAAGWTALRMAAFQRHEAVVRRLLAAGAEVGLVEAALLGDQCRLRELLAAGADLHRDWMDEALWWAAGGGQAEAVRLLLDHGAAVDATGGRGATALQHAARDGRLAVMRLLLARGADPNAPDRCPASVGMGGTALMACLLYSPRGRSRKAQDAIQLLLEHGADPGAAGASGWTPLMLASAAGEAEIAGLLLRRGADPNVFSDPAASAAEGCSTTNALQLAVGNARLAIVRLLLGHGADVHARNNSGESALSLAERWTATHPEKQPELAEILTLLRAAEEPPQPGED